MRDLEQIVYVIGTYPSLTTTFIDREILFLRQSGVDLRILAIYPPADSTPLSQSQRQLQQGVTYLLPVSRRTLISSQAYFAALRPRAYLGTLGYLLSRPHPSFQDRWKTLLHFAEGVYAAYLLRGWRIRELHAHFVDRAATVALVIGRLLGLPYSLSIHAGPDIFATPVLVREKVLNARHAVTCTAFNKLHLERLVGQDLGHKISYIHHGLDLDMYSPAPFLLSGRPLLLSVGQLTERKGFDHLIRACRVLQDRGYDFTCHIVGSGPQRSILEELIAQYHMEDRVVLCGALSHDEVIQKYRQARFFVLPCVPSSSGNVDGIPNVLPEAMAMQVPVISTSLSGIPEILSHQVNGLLVPPGDDAALVDAMARLLDDPALCQELGQNGRKTVVEQFNVEQNVRQFAETLWPDWFLAGADCRRFSPQPVKG